MKMGASAVCAALLLAMGGCSSRPVSNPDAGGFRIRDGATADGSAPADATSARLFPPPFTDTLRKGATTVTARVFASFEDSGEVSWLGVGNDGSLFAQVGANSPKTIFYDAGGPSAQWSNIRCYNCVVHLDRQANTSWVVQYDSGYDPPAPALLPDGALILASLPTVPGETTTAAVVVWRLETDGTKGWSVNFGPLGIYFGGLAPTLEGDVILVGTAFQDIDLDPGPATVVRAEPGPFVMKLAGATGELLWVRTPTDAPWTGLSSLTGPDRVMVRADGRIVVGATATADYSVGEGLHGSMMLLAADGTTDAATWVRRFSGPLSGWTVLPDHDVLASTLANYEMPGPDYLRLIDGKTGAIRNSYAIDPSYDSFAAGPTRVVGELFDPVSGYRALDWWSPDGIFQGGLQFVFSPGTPGVGVNLSGGEVAVAADGHVIMAVTIGVPADATPDIDPGPGVSSFVTPSAGFDLAILELAP